MHIGGDGFHRVDQANVHAGADVDFHPKVPLLALAGLVHLGIPLPSEIVGGAGGSDQGGVYDRCQLHGHGFGPEVDLLRLKDLLAVRQRCSWPARPSNRSRTSGKGIHLTHQRCEQW